MARDIAISISLQGQQTIQQLNMVIPEAVDHAMEQILRTLQPKVRAMTPEGIRYVRIGRKKSGERMKGARGQGRYVPSGEFKNSWQFSRTSDTISVSTATPYANILEEGTYPGPGKPRMGLLGGARVPVSPRVVANAGGWFSRRAREGILAPIVADVVWLKGVTDTIVAEIFKGINGRGGGRGVTP